MVHTELMELAGEMREYAQLVRDGIPFSLGVATYDQWAHKIEVAARVFDEMQALTELIAQRVSELERRVGEL